MKAGFVFLAVVLSASTATAQQQHASYDAYVTCPLSQTRTGLETVRNTCGSVSKPNISLSPDATLGELLELKEERDAFQTQVNEYGSCVTGFINSYRRPGGDANSSAPDEAACAHAWAEDQLTETLREFTHTCFDYNNRAVVSGGEAYEGSCTPNFSGTGAG